MHLRQIVKRRTSRRGAGRPAGIAAVALALLPALLAPSSALAGVQAAELQHEIDELTRSIRSAQKADGSFAGGQWIVGKTSLAILALRAAGAPADDAGVRRAADFLARRQGNPDRGVYETSLKVLALQGVDARAYLPQIGAGAAYLVRAQQPSGGWSYELSGRADNSNSQYAVLGLHGAALGGVHVPQSVWQKAQQYFIACQRSDGGWSYTQSGTSYGSMTAAGVASLFISDLWLHVARGRCGVYTDPRRLNAGLGWLAAHFTVTSNPGKSNWKFYYLYGLERAGIILARRYFGRHDWYRAGVDHLVGDPEGIVTAGSGEDAFVRSCFRLLFLAKGNAPIAVHKAEWQGLWNKHRHDIRFLVQYVSQELDQPLDWQIVPLTTPVDELLAAPVLYISGSGRPSWSVQETTRIKEYVQAGGFVLVDAPDGAGSFDRSFRLLAERAFPDESIVDLPKDHPIYTCYFHLPEEDRPPLQGIKGPCWLYVLYAPEGLSCPWDVADFDHPNFQLGTNIIAYVTGLKKLEGKLTERTYFLPSGEEPEQRGGAFVMGQIVHPGQWRPHKVAWGKVLEQTSAKAGLAVYSQPLPIDLETDSPFDGHMLYLTGVEELELDPEETDKLTLYLERGGFIFVEAACGSSRFDRSFRELMEQMFPGNPLQELPVGHPLLESGERIDTVQYTEAVLREHPGLNRPLLEFIEQDGRAVIVYSKFDISSAIDGHPCYSCPAVMEPAASRLALKILLYGLSS